MGQIIFRVARQWIAFLALSVTLLVALCGQANSLQEENAPGYFGIREIPLDGRGAASRGLLDLRTVDIYREATRYPLMGWNFLWKRFPGPGELEGQGFFELASQALSINAGQRWSDSAVHQPALPRAGYGTYFIRLLLPPAKGEALGLYLGPANEAMEIRAGSRILGRTGLPASTPLQTQTSWGAALYVIPPELLEGPSLDIEIRCAMHSGIFNGLTSAPILGPLSTINRSRDFDAARVWVLAGICLVMGLYHIALFLQRPSKPSTLWFALVCLVLGLRTLGTEEVFLVTLTGPLPGQVLYLLSYLSYTALAILFVQFIQSLFPYKGRRILEITNLVLSLSYSLVCILGSPALFTSLLWYYQIYTMALGALMLGVLIRAMVKRMKNSVLFLFGLLVVLGAMVNDILKINGVVQTPSMATWGIAVFVFIQALVLARDFGAAIDHLETSGKDLAALNDGLNRFVPRELLAELERKDVTGLKLGDHVARDTTVCYIGIRDFEKINAGLPAQHSFHLINHFLSIAGPIIRSHQGYVYKYLGNRVLALFTKGCRDALNACLEVKTQLGFRPWRPNRESGELVTLEIQAGIHSGPLLIGIIGEEERLESVVLSDGVEVARQLLHLSSDLGSPLLLSAEALNTLPRPETWLFRHMGNFALDNREGSLSVHECLGQGESDYVVEKRRNRRRFEYGVHLHLTGQDALALRVFRELEVESPDDPGLAWYIARLQKPET